MRPPPSSADPQAFRAFVPLEGPTVSLGLDAGALIERCDGREVRTEFGGPVRAFVALANRARALWAKGHVEQAPASGLADELPALTAWEAIVAYAGCLDGTRSLPRQELALCAALTPALARRDPAAAAALATLVLLEWPTAFDVAASIEALGDAAEPALTAALAAELARTNDGYPKALVRLAMLFGSPESATLALGALSRTRDPDAWFDVLIEGEPHFDASHASVLAALAPQAPDRDVGKMAREIARDLAPAPRRKPRRR